MDGLVVGSQDPVGSQVVEGWLLEVDQAAPIVMKNGSAVIHLLGFHLQSHCNTLVVCSECELRPTWSRGFSLDFLSLGMLAMDWDLAPGVSCTWLAFLLL